MKCNRYNFFLIREDKIRKKRKELNKIIPKITRTLLNNFNIKKIYLFGSAITSDRFDINSDIDIAVEGLKPELFLKAASKIANLLTMANFEFDLVDLSTAPAILKEKIIKEGKLLYEKK